MQNRPGGHGVGATPVRQKYPKEHGVVESVVAFKLGQLMPPAHGDGVVELPAQKLPAGHASR